jgi:hypothetical protein
MRTVPLIILQVALTSLYENMRGKAKAFKKYLKRKWKEVFLI